jgi:tetratricopeptide (TPR) repeat protein
MAEKAWTIVRFVVVLSPFLFSGVSPILLPVFVLLCLFSGALLLWDKASAQVVSGFYKLSPFVLLAIYVVLQIVPLPPSWIKKLSPVTWYAYQETIWVVQPDAWMPLAVHVNATLFALLLLLSVACFYMVLQYGLGQLWRIQDLLATIMLSAILWSLTSLLLFAADHYLHATIVGWEDQIQSLGSTLSLWGLVLLPVLLANLSVNKETGQPQLPGVMQLRHRLRLAGKNGRSYLFIAISLVILAAALSNWKLTVVFVLFGCGMYSWLGNRLRRPLHISRLSIWAILPFLITLVLFALNGIDTKKNLDLSWLLSDCRVLTPWLWTWFGAGLGAHADIMRCDTWSFDAFGNHISIGTVKELWLGLGVVGAVVFVISIVAVLVQDQGHSNIVVSKVKFSRKIKAGTLAGLCLTILLVTFYDSSSWISGLFFLVLFVASSTLVECLWQGSLSKNVNQLRRIVPLSFLSRSAAVVIFSVLVVMIFTSIGTYVAQETLSYQKSEPVDVQTTANQSLLLSDAMLYRYSMVLPYDSSLHLLLSNMLYNKYQIKSAYTHLVRALRHRPLNPEGLVLMATLLATRGEYDHAKRLLASTHVVERFTPNLQTERQFSRLLDLENKTVAIELAQLVFKRKSENVGRYLNIMLLNDWNVGDLATMLPSDPEVQLAYGKILLAHGDSSAAEDVFMSAVTKHNENIQISPEVFLQVATYYFDNNQLEKAYYVTDRGVDFFPENKKLILLRDEINQKL